MKRPYIFAVFVVATFLSHGTRAQSSFAGTWRLNLAKSELTGDTTSIEKTPSGLLRFDSQGYTYDFDLSGKEFRRPDGGTASWREVNQTTWEGTNKTNGKVTARYRFTLKGDSLTSVMTATSPDGRDVEMTAVYSRVSGGPGFFGKWKSTEIKGAPTTMEIVLEGTDGITVRYPEFQQACKGRFDGKEYPVRVAGGHSNQTLTFERNGANSVKITTKMNGKPFYLDVLTLSNDGKTLTDEGNPVSAKEPIKAVYERQWGTRR
jgi:hypothetical protein